MKFYIIDVFAKNYFDGNPAGVVILKEGEDFPSKKFMIETAAELRYSETAFVQPLRNGEFKIRYFTPADEVDLCGHATIGSFTALLSEDLIQKEHTYVCHTLAGKINIYIDSVGFVMMDMAAPKSMAIIEDERSLDKLYNIMGIQSPGEKGVDGLLPRIISTGLPDIIMPLKSKEDLSVLKPDMPALSQLSSDYKVTGVHAFTLDGGCLKEKSDHNIFAYCRNFAPLYDIDEEAATGTSNGALTYYLYLEQLITEGFRGKVVQGEAMGRPSIIHTSLAFNEGNSSLPSIKVGGSGVILVKGNIFE